MNASRSQLSSIDMIAPAGVPLLQWAYDRLIERRSMQIDVLTVLNIYLAKQNLPHVSRSAFSRWAIKVRRGQTTRPALIAPKGGVS